MALRLCVLVVLAVGSFAQFQGFAPAGYARQGYAAPVAGTPLVGYDVALSQLQRTPIYGANMGYDLPNTVLGRCKNGVPSAGGSCMCFPGYQGTSCSTPVAEISLNQQTGVVCVQTPADPSALASISRERAQRVGLGEGEVYENQMRLVDMMASPGSGAGGAAARTLRGPGIAPFCPRVPNGSPMAPVNLKAARTDYGYITCTEYQTCYNRPCPPCTMFNPRTGGCDKIPNPQARGLPLCNIGAGETPPQVKALFTRAVLARPKMSADATRVAAPVNPVAQGQAFPVVG